MNRRRTGALHKKIYKTTSNLNTEFMKQLFKTCKTNRVQGHYELNLEIPKSDQVSFDTKGLRIQDTRVWNVLPFLIKSKEDFQVFKDVTKIWVGSKCSFNNCFETCI